MFSVLLLNIPWKARRSNQLILKEINTECSLEGLMLKFQYFEHLMWTADSLEKTLMLGKNRVKDEIVGWYHRFNGHELEKAPGNGEGQGSLACCSPWGCEESDNLVTENNSNKKFYSYKSSIFSHLTEYNLSLYLCS